MDSFSSADVIWYGTLSAVGTERPMSGARKRRATGNRLNTLVEFRSIETIDVASIICYRFKAL